MSKDPGLTHISHSRTIEALHKALDETYRQLLESAKSDWQRLFAGLDPSDASVTVRISEDELAEELAGIPRAGFLSLRKPAINRKVRRRSR
jgi:hypothetical protein